jgi:hypothetical protein
MRQTYTQKEIGKMSNKINIVSPSGVRKEIISAQGSLDLGIERERDVNGIGMGVLSDGTPYLNQRGLAALCGVMNAHIGTISSQWNDRPPKPRIQTIKSLLTGLHSTHAQPHVEVPHKGVVHFCYPADVCLAVLEYYALDAGANVQPEARRNYRTLAGSKLRDMIYSQVGYDPSGTHSESLRKWHERIELNHQSAPHGFFCVFNEAHTVMYELIMAGGNVGEKMVPDISIGQHWSRHWVTNDLAECFGERSRFPHKYPDDHPQSRSNPQSAFCYPFAALGEYRRWLQEDYLDGGRFKNYIKGQKSIPPSVAELAIGRLSPALTDNAP